MQINSGTAERFNDIDYKNLKVANRLKVVVTPLWRYNVFNKFAIFKRFWRN